MRRNAPAATNANVPDVDFFIDIPPCHEITATWNFFDLNQGPLLLFNQ